MKLHEIFALLLLGMIIFIPVALIVFYPKISKNTPTNYNDTIQEKDNLKKKKKEKKHRKKQR